MLRLPTPFLLLTLVLLPACGGDQALDDAARDLTLAVGDSVAALADTARSVVSKAAVEKRNTIASHRPPEPPPPLPGVAAGAALTIYSVDTLTSRHNKVGDTITAVVVDPVVDSRGREVLPVGSVFSGTIRDIAPAETPGGQGRMIFTFDRVNIEGRSYLLASRVDSVGARMKGRGVTAGDAAKVGAGTVVGAVAGRIFGGNKTGTIVGAAAGTAAGVGIAAATRDVDIILDAGAPIWIVLPQGFERS